MEKLLALFPELYKASLSVNEVRGRQDIAAAKGCARLGGLVVPRSGGTSVSNQSACRNEGSSAKQFRPYTVPTLIVGAELARSSGRRTSLLIAANYRLFVTVSMH
jgi:hypothetical protein